MKLWEADHPYYCNEGNYYAPGMDQPVGEYDSWEDFVAEEGDSDPDYNLLFRFDWQKRAKTCGRCGGRGTASYNSDVDCPDCGGEGEIEGEQEDVLLLFWMGQRKGLYRWSEVKVEEQDEPAIREWLEGRFAYLKALWAPLA